ncbi:MAG: MFS transporter, partial [Burkholderiaceae bacterium]|nr:MFS transporter [Burkholderiaceae bacterium]
MTRTAVTVPLAELRMKARRHAFMRAQHKNLLIFLLGLLVGLEFFENGMFIFGANYIMGGVDAAPEEFVRAQASYAVGSLITIVLQQRLTMRFGYKRFLLATIVLFMGGLWGCAKSNSIDQMVLARLVLGAGGGAFFTSSRILITLMFPLSERFRASLWYAVCLIGASAVAPAFAAWVIETWDWSMVFYSV